MAFIEFVPTPQEMKVGAVREIQGAILHRLPPWAKNVDNIAQQLRSGPPPGGLDIPHITYVPAHNPPESHYVLISSRALHHLRLGTTPLVSECFSQDQDSILEGVVLQDGESVSEDVAVISYRTTVEGGFTDITVNDRKKQVCVEGVANDDGSISDDVRIVQYVRREDGVFEAKDSIVTGGMISAKKEFSDDRSQFKEALIIIGDMNRDGTDDVALFVHTAAETSPDHEGFDTSAMGARVFYGNQQTAAEAQVTRNRKVALPEPTFTVMTRK
ncbi:MAG: hypothetical protein Q7T11_03355 [Deltaproteobacteria bacterium]|nr:hypothetical protein [Deltaproteobacteria bacterium]